MEISSSPRCTSPVSTFFAGLLYLSVSQTPAVLLTLLCKDGFLYHLSTSPVTRRSAPPTAIITYQYGLDLPYVPGATWDLDDPLSYVPLDHDEAPSYVSLDLEGHTASLCRLDQSQRSRCEESTLFDEYQDDSVPPLLQLQAASSSGTPCASSSFALNASIADYDPFNDLPRMEAPGMNVACPSIDGVLQPTHDHLWMPQSGPEFERSDSLNSNSIVATEPRLPTATPWEA